MLLKLTLLPSIAQRAWSVVEYCYPAIYCFLQGNDQQTGFWLKDPTASAKSQQHAANSWRKAVRGKQIREVKT